MNNRISKIRSSIENKSEKWLLHMIACNRKHLYVNDKDVSSTVLYCTANQKAVGIRIGEFLLLGEYSRYIARGVGTAETAKYYLHKQTKQVYELYDSDYTDGRDSCLVEAIEMTAPEVLNYLERFEFHRTEPSAQRYLKIERIVDESRTGT